MASNESAVLFDQPGPKGRKTIRIVNWIAGIIFAVVVVLILVRLHNPPDGENQLSWELWKPALEREAWTDFYLPGLWMTVKASIDDVVPVIVKTLDHGIIRGDTAVEIHIDPQDTARLRYGDYIYDVELVMADGYTDTVIPPSQLTITGEVTTHD